MPSPSMRSSVAPGRRVLMSARFASTPRHLSTPACLHWLACDVASTIFKSAWLPLLDDLTPAAAVRFCSGKLILAPASFSSVTRILGITGAATDSDSAMQRTRPLLHWHWLFLPALSTNHSSPSCLAAPTLSMQPSNDVGQSFLVQPGTPPSLHLQVLQPSLHSSPTDLLKPSLSLHCWPPRLKLHSLRVQAATPVSVQRQVLHSTSHTSPTALSTPALSWHCFTLGTSGASTASDSATQRTTPLLHWHWFFLPALCTNHSSPSPLASPNLSMHSRGQSFLVQPATPSSPHLQLLQPSFHSSPTSLLPPFSSLH